jgi:hypothetical protein
MSKQQQICSYLCLDLVPVLGLCHQFLEYLILRRKDLLSVTHHGITVSMTCYIYFGGNGYRDLPIDWTNVERLANDERSTAEEHRGTQQYPKTGVLKMTRAVPIQQEMHWPTDEQHLAQATIMDH